MMWYGNPFTFPNRLVEGLALRLPSGDESFSKDAQEQWLDLAKAVLEVSWSEEAQSEVPPAGGVS